MLPQELIINNPELIYIYDNEKVEEMRTDVTFKNKMTGFIYLHFNMYENLHVQFLSKSAFSAEKQKKVWEEYIKKIFETKLAIEVWEDNKNLYDTEFSKYMNVLIKKTT